MSVCIVSCEGTTALNQTLLSEIRFFGKKKFRTLHIYEDKSSYLLYDNDVILPNKVMRTRKI